MTILTIWVILDGDEALGFLIEAVGMTAQLDENSLQKMEQHLERYVGPYDTVIHEIVSGVVHVDLHVVPPTPDRHFFTVVTSGMSALPMLPRNGGRRFAEVMLCLAQDWVLSGPGAEQERWWWPMRLLKTLAQLPHEQDCCLGPGVTIPNGDPATPYADNTTFCCALLARPIMFEDKFLTLKLPDRSVEFYCVIPLYQEEMELKLSDGLDALFDAFDIHAPEISEVFDPKRPNAAVGR